MWFGVVFVYMVISALLSNIPLIGEASEWLLSPVFIGGIMLGCDALRRGERLRFSHLFDGFKRQHFVPLLTVGAINLAIAAATVLCGYAATAGGYGYSGTLRFGSFTADPWQALQGIGLPTFAWVIALLLVISVYSMANWFAPALIVLRDASPAAAMVASFRAVGRNWASFLVYGAIGIFLLVAVSLTFVVLAAAISIETFMVLINGGAILGSIGGGLALLAVAFVVFLIIIGAVVFGSVFAGYRDTLSPIGPSSADPPAEGVSD